MGEGRRGIDGEVAYNEFFATAEDLRPVLAVVESKRDIKYIECGLFDDEQRPIIRRLSSLLSLSTATSGDAHKEPTYLVTRAEAILNVRPVPQRRGGTKFAVDQLVNPGSIVLRPGGKYLGSVVITGMLGTVKDDRQARKLLDAFINELRLEFSAIKEYSVGPAALKLLKAGGRLTNAVTASTEYDLSTEEADCKE